MEWFSTSWKQSMEYLIDWVEQVFREKKIYDDRGL